MLSSKGRAGINSHLLQNKSTIISLAVIIKIWDLTMKNTLLQTIMSMIYLLLMLIKFQRLCYLTDVVMTTHLECELVMCLQSLWLIQELLWVVFHMLCYVKYNQTKSNMSQGTSQKFMVLAISCKKFLEKFHLTFTLAQTNSPIHSTHFTISIHWSWVWIS